MDKKKIEPFPYPYYLLPVLVICIAGLFTSLYLAVSHYRVYTDIEYESFCAISQSINCDTVSQSPYSILLGIPVPVWGILGYTIFLFVLIHTVPRKAENKRLWTLLLLLATLYSGYSIFLAGLSTYVIHSYCIMCIVTYCVNLLLLFYTWLIRKRFSCEALTNALALDTRYLFSFQKQFVLAIVVLVTVITSMLLFFPEYWKIKSPVLTAELATGQTDDGHPWIGSENPELTIYEFSDYRCFQCRKMHYYLRQIISKNPDKIQLIHRHFPMDHIINPIVKEPFHNGSAKLAILAIYANEENKFWLMNDALFDVPTQKNKIDLRSLSETTGLSYNEMKKIFRNGELWEKLRKDLQAGLKYGLTGTPGFVINHDTYMGNIPAEILSTYLTD